MHNFCMQDMSVQSQEHAVTRLKGKAEEFQKHATMLAEVARQSAAISADARSKHWKVFYKLKLKPLSTLYDAVLTQCCVTLTHLPCC